MESPPLQTAARSASAWLLVCLFPVVGMAQAVPQPDVAGMSIEDLLAVEVISTASKFPQSVKEAPASITVISAEEIRRFGYRTIADALRAVRGFYNSYDRNYTYVGMRGFSRPGDYNTRLLLLVDGHRINDGVYDMAPFGTDFLFDMSLIARIEIIRGPGSSLYGSNALFAVINVITKSGASHSGVQADLMGGSLGTRRAAGSYGRVFGDGREVLIGGSGYLSDGQRSIHYPEFDTDAGGPAIARDLDHEEAASLFGSFSAGRFSLRAGAVHRDKLVPTASYGTAFGDGRERTADDRFFVTGVYDGPLGKGWLATARLGYDYYGYQGAYPYAEGDDTVMFTDASTAHAVTGELTARRRAGRMHMVTAGVEVRRDLQNRQTANDASGQYLDVDVPATKLGLYVQDEMRPVSWLLVNAGLRVDRSSGFVAFVTPRAGLVLLPRPQTAVKVLYGRAFRAPNPYERYYYTSQSARGLLLRPEQIRSAELVVEESLSTNVRLTVTAFDYDMQRIIEQRATDVEDIFFENAGRTRGRGIEAETEARFDNGIVARASHAFTRVRDHERDQPVSNSPEHLSTVSLQVPLSRVVVAVEGQRVGERLDLSGVPLRGFFAPNLTVTTPAGQRIGFSLGVYNALNRSYGDPGAEEHLQSSIRQDGRTVRFRLDVRF